MKSDNLNYEHEMEDFYISPKSNNNILNSEIKSIINNEVKEDLTFTLDD